MLNSWQSCGCNTATLWAWATLSVIGMLAFLSTSMSLWNNCDVINYLLGGRSWWIWIALTKQEGRKFDSLVSSKAQAENKTPVLVSVDGVVANQFSLSPQCSPASAVLPSKSQKGKQIARTQLLRLQNPNTHTHNYWWTPLELSSTRQENQDQTTEVKPGQPHIISWLPTKQSQRS
jgi:hypothetical protein